MGSSHVFPLFESRSYVAQADPRLVNVTEDDLDLPAFISQVLGSQLSATAPISWMLGKHASAESYLHPSSQNLQVIIR